MFADLAGMQSATKIDGVADRLAQGIERHGGRSEINSDGGYIGNDAVRISASVYDRELRYLIDGEQATADVCNVDPRLLHAAVGDLPSACSIEIWHGDRDSGEPLRYSSGRDAARCLALATAMSGSRVSVRIRFANSDSVIAYTDRVLAALRRGFVAAAPNVIPFPARAVR